LLKVIKSSEKNILKIKKSPEAVHSDVTYVLDEELSKRTSAPPEN